MIEWIERPKGIAGIAYEAPGGLVPMPIPPRAAFDAVGRDGAKIEAYRWGSALGGSFLLELRRYGAPGLYPDGIPDGARKPFYHDPVLVSLDELQSAIDALIPPGIAMLLILASNGPDTSYSYNPYACVRVGQPQAAPDARRSALVQ